MNFTEKASTIENNQQYIENQQRILLTAINLGRKIARDAIWHDGKCNWTGQSVEVVEGSFQTVTRSFGCNLYSGAAGILVFLSKLHTYHQDPLFTKTINGIIKNIDFLLLHEKNLTNYGPYSGKLGVGWSLWEAGKNLNNEELKNKGIQLIKEIAKSPILDTEVDIIGGAAGAIVFLVKIICEYPDQELIAIANNCASFLIEKATKNDSYWSWKTVDPENHLTGYSHGASGIALSFLELYSVTNNDTYKEVAQKAFAYEQQWYNTSLQNWADLRGHQKGTTPSCGDVWCHGAPGIALSRLRAYELTQEQYYLQEAQTALETTYKSTLQSFNNNATRRANYSLCHGLGGNADVLLYGYQLTKNETYLQFVHQVAQAGITWYDQFHLDWPSGVNDPSGATLGQGDAPGLLLGSAGIGYFYLRVLDFENTKTVLL